MFRVYSTKVSRDQQEVKPAKITIRTKIEVLKHLNSIVEKQCDNVDCSWIEFIRKYCKSVALPPNKYAIQKSRHPKVLLDRKVQDVLNLYKSGRSRYVVHLVEANKKRGKGRSKKQKESTIRFEERKPIKIRIKPMPPRPSSPAVLIDSNATIAVPHRPGETWAESQVLPPLTPYHTSDQILNQVQLGSFEIENVNQAWNKNQPSIATNDNQEYNENVDIDDDNVSVCSTELGIINEDIKDQVLNNFQVITYHELHKVRREMERNRLGIEKHKKFTKISIEASCFLLCIFSDFTKNNQTSKLEFNELLTKINNNVLLQVRDELRKIKEENINWHRLGSIAPQSKNLLTTIFSM